MSTARVTDQYGDRRLNIGDDLDRWVNEYAEPLIRCRVCQCWTEPEWIEDGACDGCFNAGPLPEPSSGVCELCGAPTDRDGQLCPTHAEAVHNHHQEKR